MLLDTTFYSGGYHYWAPGLCAGTVILSHSSPTRSTFNFTNFYEAYTARFGPSKQLPPQEFLNG